MERRLNIATCSPRHRLEIIDNLFEDLDEITPDDGDGITNWFGTLGTTGAAATSVLSTENSARSGRNSANTTSLNNLKTTLAAERSATEAAADRLYRNSEQSAWNTYASATLTARTSYFGNYKTAENTYKTASDAADTTYRVASVTAYVGYQNATRDLIALYSTAVAHAGDTNFNLAAFFSATGGNTACQAYEFTRRENAGENDMISIASPPLLSPEVEAVVNPGFEQAWKSMSRNTPSQISIEVLEKTVSPLQDVNILELNFRPLNPPPPDCGLFDGGRTLTSEEKEFLRFVFGAVTKNGSLVDDTMIVEALDDVRLWDFGEISWGDHPVKCIPAKMALDSAGAVTLGRDVYFALGHYPQPSQNIPLIGHEIMHVLQVYGFRVGYGIWGGMYLTDGVVAALTTKGGRYRGNIAEIQAYALEATIDEILKQPEPLLQVGRGMPTGNEAAAIQERIHEIFIEKLRQQEENYGRSR